MAPNPSLMADAPIEVLEARTLFRSASVRRHGCASLRRLGNGRLLLVFQAATGPVHRNDGAVMLSHSDDDGRSWAEPFPIYAHPGWESQPLGGLAVIRDDLLLLVLGRIRFDPSLGGDEPYDGWFLARCESRDEGRSWSELSGEIRLWPEWTELYGASNPHRRSDGQLIWAAIGTLSRDSQWQAGVTVSGPDGMGFGAPVVIAADPGRNFADTDLLRVDGPRFIAVIREMIDGESWIAFSDDEARTWHGLRRVGFSGANIKLVALRDGSILCAYRDEDLSRHGVSLSHSRDGGLTWTFAGQLYSEPRADHRAGDRCGYPDIVSLGDGRLVAVLHTYPDPSGRMDLQCFTLRDRA